MRQSQNALLCKSRRDITCAIFILTLSRHQSCKTSGAPGSRKPQWNHSCICVSVCLGLFLYVCVWVWDSFGCLCIFLYVEIDSCEHSPVIVQSAAGFGSALTRSSKNRAMISFFSSIWAAVQQHANTTYCINYTDPTDYSVTQNTCLPFVWLAPEHSLRTAHETWCFSVRFKRFGDVIVTGAAFVW